jgi:hypothetical protein
VHEGVGFMKVYVVNVMFGNKEQFAGVFKGKEDAYGYLKNNNLVGTVTATELIE